MTRYVSAEVQAALAAHELVARDFICFTVKDRTTGAPVYDNEWSDIGTFTCQVIDPETGGVSTRTFFGSGSLISMTNVQLVSNLTVQTVTISLSQVADRMNDLIRTYECKQGTIQYFRGFFDPTTRELVSPAVPRFVGFIDKIEVKTPKENAEGSVELTCTSHTQEMTRSNPDTRSDASQRLRNATDNFFQSVTTVGGQQFFWGRASGAVATVATGSAKVAALS